MMGIVLNKGGNISLSKGTPDLKEVSVCLGWETRQTTGADYDLDASAIATGSTQKALSDFHFVFYNNLRSPEGAIEHTGDNLVGGDGVSDDEVINVDLVATPPLMTHIFFAVSIHDAHARGQSFGQVRNAYIRVLDRATGVELVRFNLSEDASSETAMVFGELYRKDNGWSFRAIGQGYASGLLGILRDYGLNASA
jgi:tellurium resistance protein TerD